MPDRWRRMHGRRAAWHRGREKSGARSPSSGGKAWARVPRTRESSDLHDATPWRRLAERFGSERCADRGQCRPLLRERRAHRALLERAQLAEGVEPEDPVDEAGDPRPARGIDGEAREARVAEE